MRMKIALVMMALGGLCFTGGSSFAQNAITAPAAKQIGAAKTQMEPALIVLNSRGAKLADGKLVLFVERIGESRLATARPEVFLRAELVPAP